MRRRARCQRMILTIMHDNWRELILLNWVVDFSTFCLQYHLAGRCGARPADGDDSSPFEWPPWCCPPELSVYKDRRSVNLVMELCSSGDLLDRVIARGHHRSERAVVTLCREILSVLDSYHSRGVCRWFGSADGTSVDWSGASPLLQWHLVLFDRKQEQVE